jgi:hypothetical protein
MGGVGLSIVAGRILRLPWHFGTFLSSGLSEFNRIAFSITSAMREIFARFHFCGFRRVAVSLDGEHGRPSLRAPIQGIGVPIHRAAGGIRDCPLDVSRFLVEPFEIS